MSKVDAPSSLNLPLRAIPLRGDPQQTINARDLHAFLKVRKMFAHWIKDRITQYGFIENQDFVCLPVLASKEGRGGHNRVDYFLSLDMAKEVSMVERNAQGKIARQYFIQCEKMALASHTLPAEPLNIAWDNPLQVAEVMHQALQRVVSLQAQLQNSTPRLDAGYFPNGERPPVITPAENAVLLYQKIQEVEQEIVLRGYTGRLKEVVATELGKSPASIQRAKQFGVAFFRLHAVHPEAAGRILLGQLRGALGALGRINELTNAEVKRIGRKIMSAAPSAQLSHIF